MQKRRTLLALIICLAAVLISSCGAKGDPWDYSKQMTGRELIPTDVSKDVFTGNEWTGKNYIKDVNGIMTPQSSIVRLNTIGYHAVGTVVYDSVDNALKGSRMYDRSVSPYYKLITGDGDVWQLAVYKNLEDAVAAGVSDGFYKPEYDMSTAPIYEGEEKIYSSSDAYYGGFKDVTLPASWQTQGFDFPIYTNYIYPWNDGAYGNERVFAPGIPTVTNPVGFYRYEFDVSPDWLSGNRRVYISFGGVESAYYVYVNGHQVGYSEDSFDAADYDITPFLNSDGKDNLLAVRVHRWCDGSYFENQDFLRLAGIFRDIYLYSTPGVRISDFTAVTDLDDAYKNATLKLSVDVTNTTVEDVGSGEFSLDVRLYDADMNNVFADNPLRKSVPKSASGNTVTAELTRKVNAPHLWSDENPYLYTLVISLYDKNGAYYGSISQQLGFREISFTPTEGTVENESYSQVLLNGMPMILKGVNRHEINPETGRYLPMELEEKDVLILKSLNINAVRTSHYPDDENFYNMCDKYGILVLGECNVETHYNVSAQDTETYFKEVVRDRIEAHTNAYRNRTCIVIWSMGNETIGGSETFLNCIQELKQRDPTRPIHFESQGSGGGVDIASTMYSSVADIESRGQWENRMPYLTCEYAHAMGNSVGNLYEYWEVYRKYDNLLGGFIWDFVDQAIWTEIPSSGYDYYGNGKYLAYGGSWGDNPNSGDFCQNGIISADRSLQPEADEVKYVYQPVWFSANRLSKENRVVNVYNEFRFTDLSEFDFTYEIINKSGTVGSGKLEDISCKPLETVQITLPEDLYSVQLGETFANLYCRLKNDTLWGKAGDIIASEQFELSSREVEDVIINDMPELTVTEDGNDIVITNPNGAEIRISKSTGVINTYTLDGDEILVSGPNTSFKRAHLSNDNLGSPLSDAKITSAEELEYSLSEGNKVFTLTENLKFSVSGVTENVQIIIYGDGSIKYTGNLDLPSDITEIYRYGANLVLPKDFEQMTYFGRGPADTYSDRNRGSFVGLYSQTVSDSFYPYGNPQDTGNKTDVRTLTLENDKYKVTIQADDEIEASSLHYTASDLERARAPYQLKGEPEYTYLNLSYKTRGTGGASCGPETLDKYKVRRDSRGLSYSFTIIPTKK